MTSSPRKISVLVLVSLGALLTTANYVDKSDDNIDKQSADKSLCSSYGSCELCGTDSSCGWCASTATCVTGNSFGPTSGSCSLGTWYHNTCPCTSYSSCAMCTYDPLCGWCSSTNSCESSSLGGHDCQSGFFESTAMCARGSDPDNTCEATCIAGIWSSYNSTYSEACVPGYVKTGKWCKYYGGDVCCAGSPPGSGVCCELHPDVIAAIVIGSVLVVGSCVLCCLCCKGCPLNKSRQTTRDNGQEVQHAPPMPNYDAGIYKPY